VDLGFRSDHLITLGVDANLARFDATGARRAFDGIVRAVEAVPGVSAAAWSSTVPIKKGASSMSEVQGDGASPIGIFTSDVGPGYFDVMQIPLLEGRGILATDDSTHGGVVVINQRAAEELWPGQSALGRTIRIDRTGPPMEVIGIVRNGRYLLIGESPRPYMFRALAQHYSPAVFLNVRTSADPEGLIPSVRSAIASVSRDLTPFDMRTMDEALDASPNGTLMLRVGAGFATVIGGLAVALTLVGLYGVIAYSVVQRTREIGLRMALGATRWTVVRSILADGAKLAAGGIAAGIVIAVLVSRMVGGLLVGSRSADAAIFAAVAIGLAAAALLAAYIPANRASRIDPVKAIGEG
jgi:putative ABC transport system permease protein